MSMETKTRPQKEIPLKMVVSGLDVAGEQDVTKQMAMQTSILIRLKMAGFPINPKPRKQSMCPFRLCGLLRARAREAAKVPKCLSAKAKGSSTPTHSSLGLGFGV